MIGKQISSNDWMTFLRSLHNEVRNSPGIKLTGLGALNEINNYLMLFFIERNYEEYNLSEANNGIIFTEDSKFSYIYNNFCKKEHIDSDLKNSSLDSKQLYYGKLWLHYTVGLNSVLQKLLKYSYFKNLFRNEVTSLCAYVDDIKGGKTIQKLIHLIWTKFSELAGGDDKVKDLELDDFGFDAFGDAYEKFKQEATTDSGKTTGQHFTPNIIKEYIIEEMKPKYNEVFYEPACGTGGFIHHAVKYVKDTNNNKDKYKTFCKNLYANECNPEIYRPLAINMLIHDIYMGNIRKNNSLDYSSNGSLLENKIDVICTNPPFGGGDSMELNSIKASLYYEPILSKPVYTKKNEISKSNTIVKDIMAQFLIHIIRSLKDNGRCGTVSDRGILNNGTDSKNSWQTKLRKYLLETCNLYKVVLLPKETFTYTTFATCILFFKKGEPTKEIEFIDLKFDLVNAGQKIYKINEDSKKVVLKISIDQIKDKNYSLKIDDYIEKKQKVKTDYIMIKLGNICQLLTKSKHNASESLDDGLYNFYTSSNIIKKSNHNDYNEETLIIGSGGNGSIFLDSNFSCSSHNFLLKNKNDNISLKYIYYYLKINFKSLQELFKGQALKNLSQSDLLNYEIPNISLDDQKEIVEFLDNQLKNRDINIFFDEINKKECDIFKLLIKKNYNHTQTIINIIYDINDNNKHIDKIKNQITLIFNANTIYNETKEYKLGDIIIYQQKKLKLKAGDAKTEGLYRFYSSSQEKIMYYDEYEFEDKCVLLGRGGSPSVHIAEKFCISHDDVYVLKPNNKLDINYLYLYLYYNKDKLIFTGSGLKHLSKENINNILIPLPSLEDQNMIVNKINKYNEFLSQYESYNKSLQEELESLCNIKIKETESNSNPNSEVNTEINTDIQSNIDDDIADIISNIEEDKPKKNLLLDEEPVKKRVIKKKKVIK